MDSARKSGSLGASIVFSTFGDLLRVVPSFPSSFSQVNKNVAPVQLFKKTDFAGQGGFGRVFYAHYDKRAGDVISAAARAEPSPLAAAAAAGSRLAVKQVRRVMLDFIQSAMFIDIINILYHVSFRTDVNSARESLRRSVGRDWLSFVSATPSYRYVHRMKRF